MLVRLLLVLVFMAMAPLSLAQDSVQTLEPPAGVAPSEAIVGVPPAPPPPCGTQQLAIARMSWPSAALLAEIHSRLLTASYLCNIAVQDGDLAQTGSSMGANGQPAVAPEMWIARVADIWNAAMKSQNVRQAGTPYAETVFEGWFVPDYAAAQWPEITTIDGLKAHAAEFGDGNGRGKFISCPVDWGCAVINRNMLKAYGLDQMFDIVEPANRFELDTLIAAAVGRREPILFYYWQPNAVLAQFAFKPVTLAAYDRDAFLCLGKVSCASPMPTGFAADPVVIAVAEWVFLDAPQVASYFGRAKMPFAEMNWMLQQLGQDGETVESVADRFVAERSEIWRPWVGLPPLQRPVELPPAQ
ncbi:glycine betaine ABC transporter substrate-binding protein [Devosia sp. ZB163]|uniref:glycine betaine ABC transporter substrate-binding protein n=1 Tax=Devosia sp. ZB163 TaxID=3025938 RepID=UPI002360C556|nr:glycine betaine ABC transporter substrate-binding protein [Devosia sp. ZB163]MDC9826420.1 glycine betaine ABC transporter substrate-binding protein [Devosia sp. ZB163]